MKNKTILVTGGAGYIGSVCTELLIKKGYKVVVIDNLTTGHQDAVHPRAKFYKGSIGNKTLIDKIFKENKIWGVVHFAAETLVDNAKTHPEWYFSKNLQEPIVFLNSMLKNNCKRIIYSSSAAVYGDPKHFLIHEDHPTDPLNAYGFTKLVLEKIINYYAESHGFKYVIFRYFNPAGATRINGERHNPETHLIPLILKVAGGEKDKIYIFGNKYQTRDGTCIRDYLHVVDVAEAHILGLKKIDVGLNKVYNLGSERGFTVKEVIDIARKVTKKDIPEEVRPRRMGDPDKLVASSKRARKELMWNPKKGDLETIIKTAWSFYKSSKKVNL